MKRTLPTLATIAVAIVTAAVAVAPSHAAEASGFGPPPQGVVGLTASATTEVPRDTISITFNVTRDGSDAAAVQGALKQALDTALAEARKAARPGQVDVQTGNFALFPRYNKQNAISGWQGSAELVIEGRDTATLSQLAGKLNTMTVARTGFTLSREAREKVEGEVSATAIARFRAQADAYAKQFGFAGYTVREVNVNTGGDGPTQPVPMYRAQAMQATVEAPLPV